MQIEVVNTFQSFWQPRTTQIAPHDHFLPLDKYIARYGDPKKAGGNHKVMTIAGFVGVSMPREGAEEEPWRVERVYENGHEVAEDECEINAACPEEFENGIQKMFDDLNEADQSEYAETVRGMQYELFEAKRLKKGAKGPEVRGRTPGHSYNKRDSASEWGPGNHLVEN